MKSIYYSICSIALAVAMTACNGNEEPQPEEVGGMRISVELPTDITTRFGEGEEINTLEYAVYDVARKKVVLSSVSPNAPVAQRVGSTFQLTIPLVIDQEYDIMFFASSDKAAEVYTFDSTDCTVEIHYDLMTPGSDVDDIFFSCEKGVRANGAHTLNTVLTRPMAQINIGTIVSDSDGKSVAKTELSMSKVPDTLNLHNGVASGEAEVLLSAIPITDVAFPANITEEGKTYQYLMMAYILTGTEPHESNISIAQPEIYNVSLKFFDAENILINSNDIPSVPIQRNYRTNIFGSLLTPASSVNTEIQSVF